MFFITALLAASVAVAAPIRRSFETVETLETREYAQDADLLEPYKTYNTRYMALGCENKHDTPFFDQCCHPLLKIQNLQDRPAQCIPSPVQSSSAATVTSTLAPGGGDDDDCDDEPETTSIIPTTSVPLNVEPTPTKVPQTTSKAPEEPSPSPEPSTTPKATPTPTPTPKPEPETTTSKKPVQTTSAASGGNGGGGSVNTGGFATWFLQNGVAGACGKVHSEDDLIVAIDERRYGNSGAVSSLCGKQVKITNNNNGKSVVATIADDCPTCTNSNSIDLSKGTFTKLATLGEGMVPISWVFV